ncbi:major head protein [Rhodococcus phage RRH1]|uniref:Caudovirus prohead protease family protein n=1 Tax=Rhodococcus phage RRH1 TaxID=1109717 RepID=G9FGV2_9CAUD|nr:major head protein [Rhodococcus phage RRH1]AEV51841.1 caudovirus prohead protease family protein [Rhodococcus phage RRH1]
MNVYAAGTTQSARPWKATVRTVVTALIGSIPLIPVIVDALGLGAIPWIATVTAVIAAIARILADGRTERFLRTYFPWLAADPDVPNTGRHRADGDVYGSGTSEHTTVFGTPSEQSSATIHGSAGAPADAPTRVVSGLVLPWNTPGGTNRGRIVFPRGSLSLPTDIRRVKLFRDHTGTRDHAPVGYALDAEDRPDGLWMSFAVADTVDAAAALEDIRNGLRDAFSVEATAVRMNGANVVSSLLAAVALVSVPAYADARVEASLDPQPSPEGTPAMNRDQLIAQLLASGLDQAAAEAAADRILAEATSTTPEPAADPATVEGTGSTGGAPTPAATSPAPGAPAPAAAAPVSSTVAASLRPAVVPTFTATAPRRRITVADAAAAVLAVQTGHAGDDIQAALADVTNSAMVEGTPAQWIGELWSGVTYQRRIVPLLGSRALTSWRIQGFTWTTKPAVAAYAGNKAEIPSNQPAIAPYESEATRWAGGHDLDRKFYDFRDTAFLESYWRAMAESYARVTDAAAGTFVVSNATAQSTTGESLFEALAIADAAVDQALNTTAGFYLANPTDRLALLKISNLDAPAYLSMFGIDPTKIVWTATVPAGSIVAGASPAVTFHELPGSPLRVEAEHLSHGGRDAALFGYTALTLDNPDGLVRVNFAAPAGGA